MEGLPKNKKEYVYDPDLTEDENWFLVQNFIKHQKESPREHNRDDFQKEIEQLEELLMYLEKEHSHSIEYLHSATELSENLTKAFIVGSDPNIPLDSTESTISQLTHEEKEYYDVRQRVKNDLNSTANYLKYLEKETNIPKEEYNRLNTIYKKYSEAVGMLNNGKLRHKS